MYVPLREWPLHLRLGWTVGSAIRYILWLWDASQMTLRLQRAQGFDVLHHLTYGTLLGGSFLWRALRCEASGERVRVEVGAGHRRPALALGPLGGGQTAPPQSAAIFGDRWRDEALRSFVVRRLWPLVWHALLAARRAGVVMATNRETALLARHMGAQRVERVLDVGIPATFIPARMPARRGHAGITVLWVGRIMPRKGLPLAVRALEALPAAIESLREGSAAMELQGGRSSGVDVRLEIVGGGVNEKAEADLRAWLCGRPAAARVTLSGQVPFSEVGAAYERADIFIFPSLRDSTGNQLLEAMAYGLPVVCLDHQGARELVTPETGMCVPVGSMDETVEGLARAIAELAVDADRRRAMGKAGRARARAFVWEAKGAEALAVFESILSP